jgi:hypothetical protein
MVDRVANPLAERASVAAPVGGPRELRVGGTAPAAVERRAGLGVPEVGVQPALPWVSPRSENPMDLVRAFTARPDPVQAEVEQVLARRGANPLDQPRHVPAGAGRTVATAGSNPLDQRRRTAGPESGIVRVAATTAGPNPLDQRRDAPVLAAGTTVAVAGPNPLDQRRHATGPAAHVVDATATAAGPNPLDERRTQGIPVPRPEGAGHEVADARRLGPARG